MLTNTQPCISYSGYRSVNIISINDLGNKVPEGWRSLVRELCHKLFEQNWDGKVLQIKEKFGGLRFYTDVPYKLIEEYEDKSYSICQDCGSVDQVSLTNINHWLATLCNTCYEKRLNDRTAI